MLLGQVSQLQRRLSVVMLGVVMLGVVMLGVVMLGVVAPSAMPGHEKMHLLSGTKFFRKKNQ